MAAFETDPITGLREFWGRLLVRPDVDPDEGRQTLLGGALTLCDHPLMQITNPCVVSLTWTLSDAQNRPIDELKEPVEFFVGGGALLDIELQRWNMRAILGRIVGQAEERLADLSGRGVA